MEFIDVDAFKLNDNKALLLEFKKRYKVNGKEYAYDGWVGSAKGVCVCFKNADPEAEDLTLPISEGGMTIEQCAFETYSTPFEVSKA